MDYNDLPKEVRSPNFIDRCRKIEAKEKKDQWPLIYEWTKTGVITRKEFQFLIDIYVDNDRSSLQKPS